MAGWGDSKETPLAENIYPNASAEWLRDVMVVLLLLMVMLVMLMLTLIIPAMHPNSDD